MLYLGIVKLGRTSGYIRIIVDHDSAVQRTNAFSFSARTCRGKLRGSSEASNPLNTSACTTAAPPNSGRAAAAAPRSGSAAGADRRSPSGSPNGGLVGGGTTSAAESARRLIISWVGVTLTFLARGLLARLRAGPFLRLQPQRLRDRCSPHNGPALSTRERACVKSEDLPGLPCLVSEHVFTVERPEHVLYVLTQCVHFAPEQ